MAIAHAMWTHGYSLQVEIPQNGTVERRGFSAKYISSGPSKPNWLHFAIPTPVLVSDKRLKVASAIVRFRSGTGGFIKAMHVYDGENKIAEKNGLNLNFPQWQLARVDVTANPLVLWGIGISLLVDFGPADGWVEFSGAGCDFL